MPVSVKIFGRSASFLGLPLGLLLLAGCADISPTASARYDGVYQLTGTPISPSSPNVGCPPFTENVVVQDGHAQFVTHGRDEWHGTVDADGVFHGESALGERSFPLAEGINAPGVIGHGSDAWCQWHYSFDQQARAPQTSG